MERLFAAVLSMSATGCLVIMVVLLARVLLKKAPKVFSYALWSVVLVRLLCPLSFSSPYYGVPGQGELQMTRFAGDGLAMQAVRPGTVPVSPQAGAEAGVSLLFVLSVVWGVGIVGMLLYGAFSYGKLRKKLVGAVHLQDNIYMADYLDTPFVMGFVRPKIYLPSTMEDWEKPYILAHEQHHIHRLDYLIKPVGFLTLCLHWFNPLVWVSFLLFCKDMEMSCDEAVLKKLGEEARAAYSTALFSLATGRKMIAGMPLAFGEGDTKGRIKNMKNWKKPVAWIVAVAALCCALLAVFLLTDKKEETTADSGMDARQMVDTLANSIVSSGQSIYFTVPAGAKTSEDWTILIYGRAEYPDGMSMSKHYLEGTVWESGKEYSIDLSDAEATRLEAEMYVSFKDAEQEIDLTAYLPQGEPVPLAEETANAWMTVSAVQKGRQVVADLAFNDAPAVQLSFLLPEGIALGEAINEIDHSSYLLNDQSGSGIGEFFFMGLAAEQKDLKNVRTDAEQLPMQIFAGAALPNHVMYEEYRVQAFTQTGAAATALFSSQNLGLLGTGEYDAAAKIPFGDRKNLALFYDYEKMPVFLQIGFDEAVVSQAACAEIAKSIEVK